MRQSWKMTDEMVDWVRSLVGVELQPKSVYFNTQASRDAIQRFADAIADTNPLWRDEQYAKHTRYGKNLAPPNFLFSVYSPAGGMPNMGTWMPPGHGMAGGTDWEYYLPIFEGDSFTYSEKILSVEPKQTRAWGMSYRIDSEVTFWNQRGDLIAKGRGWVFRLDPTSPEGGKRRPVHQYTEDELERIFEIYQQERPRGAETRWWEDVQVDEELPPLVRGPLDAQDLLAWLVGAGASSIRAHRRLSFPVKRPDWPRVLGQPIELEAKEPTFIRGPEARESFQTALEHLDRSVSADRGVGAPFDFGPQRMSWLIALLTHWQGDDGFLKSMYCELRDVNQVGDTTWLKGRVVSKEVRGEDHLVEVECWGENQLGVVTMPGRATIALPSRGA